jgi:hypothetical protein
MIDRGRSALYTDIAAICFINLLKLLRLCEYKPRLCYIRCTHQTQMHTETTRLYQDYYCYAAPVSDLHFPVAT